MPIRLTLWQIKTFAFLLLPTFWVHIETVFCNCPDGTALSCGCPASPYIHALLPFPVAVAYFVHSPSLTGLLFLGAGIIGLLLVTWIGIFLYTRFFSQKK